MQFMPCANSSKLNFHFLEILKEYHQMHISFTNFPNNGFYLSFSDCTGIKFLFLIKTLLNSYDTRKGYKHYASNIIIPSIDFIAEIIQYSLMESKTYQNLFLVNAPILHPLETPENHRFVFQGVWNDNIGQNQVKILIEFITVSYFFCKKLTLFTCFFVI